MRIRLKRKYTIVLYLIPIFVLLGLLFAEIKHGIHTQSNKGVAYNEKGDITYKVYLKENDYYDTDFLDENSSYIASLIKTFNVNYNYVSTFSDNVDYELKYNIDALLTVYDSDNKAKPIYTKTYNLMNEETINGKGKVVTLDLLDKEINYDEYNSIIQSLKKEIIPMANLSVRFNTKLVAKSSKLKKDINSSYTSTLDIPISQKTINVDLTKNNIQNSKTFSNGEGLDKNYILLIATTVLTLIIVCIAFIFYLVKTANRKSKYEQRISKILREFDRAITEAKGKLKLDRSDNPIEVKEFEELLDAHDNLNIPIVYYKLNNHASIFIVRHDKDVYYSLIRSSDFE